MHLVKWLRKNNKKLMAVVVVIIMVGFLAGPLLNKLSRRGSGGNRTIAYYDDNKKITMKDRSQAVQQLDILKALGANILFSNVQDFRVLLMGQVLFAETRPDHQTARLIDQLVQNNRLKVSKVQVSAIYQKSHPADIYWLLLRNEAEQAGISIPVANAKSTLAGLFANIFPEATYQQVMSGLVQRRSVTEEQMLKTFAQSLSVLEYAKIICSTADITDNQIRFDAGFENETMDIEFVQLPAKVFAEDMPQPGDAEITAQFEKYKNAFAGMVSDENPYSFGYKLQDRVSLEYIAVKFEDVKKIVKAPAAEEVEEFYQANRERFTEQVLSDPNDPNSELIDRIRTYGQMANIIAGQLYQNKIRLKADGILQQAKDMTEQGFENIDTENLSAEMVGDYKKAADKLSNQHNIDVYSGKTGLLNIVDLNTDEYLSRMFLQGFGFSPVALTQIVFAVEPLKSSELAPYEASVPRLFENIGPLNDIADEVIMLVRIVDTQKAQPPAGIELIYDNSPAILSQNPGASERSQYVLKETEADDLKELAAVKNTEEKAQELIREVVAHGWDKAIDKFNTLYGTADKDEPNTFSLQYLQNLRRISAINLDTIATQNKGSAAAGILLNQNGRNSVLLQHFYSLIGEDANSLETVPYVTETKVNRSFCVIKKLSVNRLTQDKYDSLKAMQILRTDYIKAQSLAVTHFNPENIIERMGFRVAKD